MQKSNGQLKYCWCGYIYFIVSSYLRVSYEAGSIFLSWGGGGGGLKNKKLKFTRKHCDDLFINREQNFLKTVIVVALRKYSEARGG